MQLTKKFTGRKKRAGDSGFGLQDILTLKRYNVNEAVKESLAEDAEDLLAFDERADEPLISYDEMVKRLKKDGRI